MKFDGGKAILRYAIAIILCCLPALASAQSGDEKPLLRLLDRIPVDAVGLVSLSDLDAVRGQIAPLAAGTAAFERDVLPFTTIYPPNGFDANSLMLFEDGAEEMLGFSIFEIDQLAGWGELPVAPVIVTGVADRAASIDRSLRSRGFETEDYRGHRVWHRQDDFQMDLSHRNEEPFGGALGTSQRFAIDRDDLLFARDWPTMYRMLDGGPSLAEDPDSVAILQAAYGLSAVGDLIDAVLIAGQPRIVPDPLQVIGAGKSPKPDVTDATRAGLPPFARYGLLLWQDGATLTGAIAIPYPDADMTSVALDRFAQLLDTTNAPSVDRPFAELLPANRQSSIFDTGDRHVLIAGFRQEAEIADPLKVTTFMRNPRQRLIDLLFRRDLDQLIGAGR